MPFTPKAGLVSWTGVEKIADSLELDKSVVLKLLKRPEADWVKSVDKYFDEAGTESRALPVDGLPGELAMVYKYSKKLGEISYIFDSARDAHEHGEDKRATTERAVLSGSIGRWMTRAALAARSRNFDHAVQSITRTELYDLSLASIKQRAPPVSLATGLATGAELSTMSAEEWWEKYRKHQEGKSDLVEALTQVFSCRSSEDQSHDDDDRVFTISFDNLQAITKDLKLTEPGPRLLQQAKQYNAAMELPSNDDSQGVSTSIADQTFRWVQKVLSQGTSQDESELTRMEE